ncbi:MAG: hypothetical protein ACRDQD_27290 [Nocardioidaceae bacterium]
MSECTRCTAPAPNAYLCPTCLIALRIDLGDVPALLGELDVTACRLDHITTAAAHRGGDQPLPFKPQATEAIWVLATTLTAWTVELGGTRASAADMARWLYSRLDVIRLRPDADTIHDELTYAIREARRVIDRPTDRRMFLGRCGAPIRSSCAEELHGLPWQDTVTCPACDTEWGIRDRRSWMLRVVEDEVRTASTLAALLTQLGAAVSVEDIQRWARQGRLHWISMDSSKRRRYRAGDVLDLALSRPHNGAA